jgi:predicted DNA-binding transcriptional regulator YafY
MGIAERRKELLKKLCRRKHDTISNLAFEFGVSERTIRRDVEVLSLTEPIYTQTGRYGGGVYITDAYSIDRMFMTNEELSVLHKICYFAVNSEKCVLNREELKTLEHIVSDYTKPTNFSKKGNKNERERKAVV